MFGCSTKHYDQRHLGEERVSFAYRLHSPSEREGKAGTQGRKIEAGPEAETTEERGLLSGPHVLVQLGFIYTPGPPTQKRHCPHTVGWTLQHQSTQSLTDMRTGQSKGGNSSTEVISSQECQVHNQD